MVDAAPIRQRWEAMGTHLDERGRRLFAATEVRTAGWGSLAIVSAITGIARSTINRGKVDLDAQPLPKGRVRCGFCLQPLAGAAIVKRRLLGHP